jgi:hypothetical protein
MLHRTMFASSGSPALPSRPFSWAMRVMPIGRALRVASGRAPSVLHLMSLVRIGTEAVITVAMRMHWPPDPPGTDLEITRAGPHHLPYDRLWAVDDQGTRYTVRFEGPGKNGTATAPVPADGPEAFASLAGILPDVDGARFALAGLSMAAGESHLHVVSSGMPQLADRFAHNWTPGFSWWLRDDAGNWHVTTAGEPRTLGDGTQAFRLRLTPPLAAVPDAAEVVVTGPATRIRATVPIRPEPRALFVVRGFPAHYDLGR